MDNVSSFVATAAGVVLLMLVVVEMDAVDGWFATTGLTSGQSMAFAAVGSTTLVAGELVNGGLRIRCRRRNVDLRRPVNEFVGGRTSLEGGARAGIA